MSRSATCRNCREPVAIPEGLEEGRPVRCPRCQAEYPLRDVLADAAEIGDDAEPPPELIVVAPAAEGGEGATAENAEAVEPADAVVAAADEAPDRPAEDGSSRPSEGGAAVDSSDGHEGGTAAQEPPSHADAIVLAMQRAEEVERVEEAEEIEVDETVDAPDGEQPGDVEAQPAEQDEPVLAEEAEPEDEAGQPADQPLEAEVAEEEEPTPEAEPEGEAVEADAEPDETADQPPSEPEPPEELQVRCPHCAAECPLGDVVVVATGEPLGPEVASAVARHVISSGERGEAVPALDAWAKVDGMPQIDVGPSIPASSEAAPAGAFDFAREDAEAEAAAAGAAPGRPRRRQQKSMGREIVSWVLGGVAGMLIAYYLLNFIRGPAGNFLKIPLPGVPHTYKYSPDWFPGWMKPAPEAEEANDAPSDEIDDLNRQYRAAPAEADLPEMAMPADVSGPPGDATSPSLSTETPFPDVPLPDDSSSELELPDASSATLAPPELSAPTVSLPEMPPPEVSVPDVSPPKPKAEPADAPEAEPEEPKAPAKEKPPVEDEPEPAASSSQPEEE